MSRIRAEYMDPAGVKHGGMPTAHWGGADPTIYATKRQLAAKGKRPGRQPVAAQLRWWGVTGYGGHGERFANLYRWDLAKDKHPATPRQLAALEQANRARRTCSTCDVVQTYVIPRWLGECFACHASDEAWAEYAETEARYAMDDRRDYAEEDYWRDRCPACDEKCGATCADYQTSTSGQEAA